VTAAGLRRSSRKFRLPPPRRQRRPASRADRRQDRPAAGQSRAPLYRHARHDSFGAADDCPHLAHPDRPVRAGEHRDFAHSRPPMFRAQPGFAGALFAAQRAERSSPCGATSPLSRRSTARTPPGRPGLPLLHCHRRELPPGGITTPWCGRYPQTFQHPPDRRGADPVAKTRQLAVDPLGSLGQGSPGPSPDQRGEPRVDRRSAASCRGPTADSGPAASPG
jgi:hypothetical protein